MTTMKDVTIIIPSLDPDKRLSGVVESLKNVGFEDIILVDDGSKEENKQNFPCGDGITLLRHDVNKGKGAALKTALNYCIENRPDSLGVITCDGDGQHLAKDVKKVCDKMRECGMFVLGVRDFSLENVPAKSRIGNRLSSAALALCCGSYISDTQTGLRAIPKSLLIPMSEVEGSRFEYETNVLLGLRSMKAKYCEVKIDTVYLDENKGTHFHPIKDTVLIFSRIIKYLLSSAAAFLTDIIIFSLCNSLLSFGVLLSTAAARLISSVVNFLINRKVVFHSAEPLFKTIVKYYCLAIPVMLISAFGVKGICLLMSVPDNSFIITLIKVLVDFILFILNYKIQKKWIFKKNH